MNPGYYITERSPDLQLRATSKQRGTMKTIT